METTGYMMHDKVKGFGLCNRAAKYLHYVQATGNS